MRLRVLTLIAGLVAVLFAVSGCDNDKGTGSGSANGFSIGDDATQVQSEAGLSVDSTITFLADAFESRNSLATGGIIDPIYYVPIDTDSDVVVSSYDTTTGWHDIYVTRAATAYSSLWRDSVQFRNADGAFQRQGNTASALSYRHRFNRTTNDTSATYYNRTGYWGYDVSGLQTDQATIDGTTSIFTSSKYADQTDTTVWRTYQYDATVTNLVVNRAPGGWLSACPVSGTITATVTSTYKRGDGMTVTRSWDMTAVFTNGSSEVTVSYRNRDWNETRQVCTVIN